MLIIALTHTHMYQVYTLVVAFKVSKAEIMKLYGT